MADTTKPRTLIEIQKLQFSDREAAEVALLAFLRETEDPAITAVTLRPKPESLNSLNGFVTYDGNERYFFKTHVEENEQVDEYYNASLLADAGYPVVSAKQITHRPGKQLVLYEILTYPTLFDLTKTAEDEQIKRSSSATQAPTDTAPFVSAQQELDRTTFSIYERTLKAATTEEDAKAPIHQLFSHRLADDGRLALFYRGKRLHLDDGSTLAFDDLADMHWKINGVLYKDTLNEIIERARTVLAPTAGPSIIGHGDAHNGNIFYDAGSEKFLMFDPAFAGRHNPLLDLTKPLFHNIFARWMYYPGEIVDEARLSFQVKDGCVDVAHSFAPSDLRVQFLESRLRYLLKPTLQLLRNSGMLRDDWQPYLRSALFCCPFLTVNLFAPYKADGTLSERYPVATKFLGLAMAVQLASKGDNVGNGARLWALIDSIYQGE